MLKCLRGSNGNGNSGSSLGKVRRHILLKVEVSQLLTLLKLKKRPQLGVGINLATILLVLKIVLPDVGIDLTSHLSASPLSSGRLSKKLGELLRNQGRLNEARRSTVARLTLTLRNLLGGTHLTSNVALKSAEVAAKRGKTRTQSLELGTELTKER
jgi:hypothetical protein